MIPYPIARLFKPYWPPYSPLTLFVPQPNRHLLMTRYKKHPSRIVLPYQHPNLLRIPARPFIFLQRPKLLEQESRRRLHPLTFNLPQADLVNDGGGQDRRGFLEHLRVCMRGEEGYNLLGCDAHADGTTDGFAGDFAGDHVGIAGREAGEELENGDLELAGGVRVYPVICLNDDEAFASVAGR